MNNKIKSVLLLLITYTIFAFATSNENISYGIEPQNNKPSNLSIKLAPRVNLPIGDNSKDYYNIGGGISLSGEYKFPSKSFFHLNGELDYNFIPLKAETSLSLISFGVGGGLSYQIIPKLNLGGNVIGGVYYGFFNSDSSPVSVYNPFLLVNTGIYYSITPSLSLGVGASYINFFGLKYNGIGISAGATYLIGVGKKLEIEEEKLPPKLKPLEEGQVIEPEIKLEMSDIEFYNIFPVLFKYYDDHPVGRARLHNRVDETITDIKVNLFVKQYMDNPKECRAPVELKGGGEKEIEFNALFTDKVLEITEGTKVSVKITLDYTLKGERHKSEKVETVRLYDRNAITWEDNSRAAAFVTAKDPAVLTFSKNVAGIIKEKGSQAINENSAYGVLGSIE